MPTPLHLHLGNIPTRETGGAHPGRTIIFNEHRDRAGRDRATLINKTGTARQFPIVKPNRRAGRLNEVNVPHAGRLKYFYKEWCNITDDQVVLSYVKGLAIPFNSPVMQNVFPKNKNFNFLEIEQVNCELKKLKDFGAVIECKDIPGQVSFSLQNPMVLTVSCLILKKFLRFKFQGNTLEFQCLSFGLSLESYIFTKLLKPVMAILRSKSYVLAIYLDE